MDGCSKCREINTVSLTCGSLQVLPWNNDCIIEKLDGWKWCRHITDFFQHMHAWNQGCIKIIMISRCYNSCSAKTQQIWNNAWLQLLSYNKKGRITVRMAEVELRISFEKRDDCKCLIQKKHSSLDHCKWRPKIMTVPLKCMTARASWK